MHIYSNVNMCLLSGTYRVRRVQATVVKCFCPIPIISIQIIDRLIVRNNNVAQSVHAVIAAVLLCLLRRYRTGQIDRDSEVSGRGEIAATQRVDPRNHFLISEQSRDGTEPQVFTKARFASASR